jgi:hypothetical protein
VLAVKDLPSGWSVNNTAHDNSPSCYTNPLEQVPSTSYAKANFAKGGSLPALSEELGTFASAAGSLATLIKSLNACKSFTVTSNGQSVSGTMGAASSPTYGDQSAAWTATLTLQGIDVNQGFVIVRKGNYLMLVALGDIGAVDTPSLQGFVAQALNKLP